MVKEEEAALVVLVRRHRRAVGAAARRTVDDEVPGAVEEEAGPAAVRRVPPGLLDALPVHAKQFLESMHEGQALTCRGSSFDVSPWTLIAVFR